MTDYAHGPDFSRWNPGNDWSVLGPSGACNIAGMRASYGVTEDPTFKDNFRGAGEHGIARIVYHWFDVSLSAVQQYNKFMSVIGANRDFVPALDFEALQACPVYDAAKMARSWINMVAAHFPPGCVIFYTNYNLGKQVRGLFDDCALWLAWPFSEYNETDPPPDKYPNGPWQNAPVLWQCTWWRSSIPGVPDQTVDWNVSNKTIDDFRARFQLVGTLPPPPPGEDDMLKMKVVTKVLNVREGPSTSYTDIGNLYYGDIVEVLDIGSAGYGAWVKFDFNGSNAWACVEYFGSRFMEVAK